MIKNLNLFDLEVTSTSYVAFSHWHPLILDHHQKNKGVKIQPMFPKTLSFDLGQMIGLESHHKLQGSKLADCKYYINSPLATTAFFNNYLDTEFVDRQIQILASGSSSVPNDILLSLSASASDKKPIDSDLVRLSSVKQRSSFIAAEIICEERIMNKKKLEDTNKKKEIKRITTIKRMSGDARQLLEKSECELELLKKQLCEEIEKNGALRKRKRESDDEMVEMKKIISHSIVRANIVCPIWHENNPKFVHYWLGFKNYKEFTIYHKCLWPDVSTVVHIKDGNITEFEKSIVTKMFFRKGLEFELLGFIWGRTNIGRYVASWAPLWGEAGADLSILDINETVLSALTPDDFINGCTDKVCGLVDGKDFKTETIRIHSGITRAGHSNKVNCSALRVLSWILNNGLNVERSEPYLGRASETHIVGVLGSHVGEVPIRQISKELYTEMKNVNRVREVSIRDTARNVGKMVASVTRLKGASMDGDEDASGGEKTNIEYGDRVDEWFDGVVAAREGGNTRERKKAKIYTTEDHDKLEKTVLESGPNKSPESKLIQLRRLQRLHKEYECGNLSSCLLSEYLEVTLDLRRDMIRVLRGRPLKGVDGSILNAADYGKRVTELKLPLRLGKFPAGWAILADRGFANDATRYPNMNVQMTPSFLSGREQFTYSELSSDMVKCKLRYISETNFARVTDENLLTDVIPARVLPFVKHCISWGHANANLCQKYKDRAYV